MAINISTDINVTTGGKLTDIGQIQGGYQSLDTAAEMNALTGSSTKKGLLQHGQIFYINDTSEVYILSQSGTGIGATYTFNSFSWPNATTASYIDPTFISSSAAASGFGAGGGTDSTGSYAVTSSNQFTGSQFFTGSLIPYSSGGNGVYDLGSITNPWKDLFLTTASLKFVRDGEVVSSVTGEPDAIVVGNVKITTSSLSIINNDGSVAQTIFSASVTDGTASVAQQSEVTYNGNRIVSNEYLTGLYSASFNAGTSGSVTDFLNAIFFPNTAPTLTSGTNYTAVEFATSGSTAFTLTASDAEAQAVTFSTASSYTAGLVVIESGGAVKHVAVPTEASFNTVDRGDGTLAHPVNVLLTDSFGSTSTTTIYINVIANTAPVFRETSDVGSIITSFNQNRNESAASEEVTKIYFTDGESDSITIRTGSDPNGHFSMSLHSNYVRIFQTTASLDYETTTAYSMSITASDEHYEAAQDADSLTKIFVGVTVVDNIQPSVNNQTLTGVNENSSDGATAGSVTATDPEGNTISWNRFVLKSLALDGTPVATGSYGGTSQSTDPHEDAFQINSGTGAVTRKTGVYLNSDLINSYVYTVTVSDVYNATSNSADITIPIADDSAPSITGVQQFYVVESARSGDNIYDSTNGYSGTIADFGSNQSVSWTVSSSNDFTVNGSGNLLLARNISGSSDTSGSTLTGQITASNSFGTSTSTTFTVNVTPNSAPDILFATTAGNLNTNLGRSGSTLATLSFSDAEGDTVNYDGVTFTSLNSQLNALRSGTSWIVQAKNNLSASTYSITASVEDEHSFRTNTESSSFSIAASDIGTLTTNGVFYVIESALNGANIVTNSNGRTGTQADLGVTYSPSYGSPAVQSFTSSNSAIVVNSSGNLTVGVNISGSATSSGDTINSDITFRDQYGNIGSGSITVNVTLNDTPDATFTNQVANLTGSLPTDTYLVGVSITDDESDTPYSMSLGGSDVAYFKAVPQNAASSSYQIQAATTIEDGTYNYSASVVDNFGKQVDYNRSITIAQTPAQYYIYLDENGTYASSEANALSSYGDANDDGTVDANSTFAAFVKGQLGETTINTTIFSASLGLEKVFLIQTGSSLPGSRTTALIEGVDHTTGSQGQTGMLIVFPSGSPQSFTQVNSMALSTGGSTAGEYVLYADRVGTGIVDAVQSAFVRYFQFSSSVSYPGTGEAGFGVIFTQNDSTNDINYFLMASSGSAPSSTQ